MKKIIGLFAMVLVVVSFTVSELYTSITKVDYIEGSKTLKFTTKVNTNHISNALKINPNTANFEAEVKKYIGKNFNVFVNGSARSIIFTGGQVSGESAWIYYETSGIESISDLKIKNTILLDVYPKQLNMVNISYKGNQKNMTFQREKETAEVSF